MSCGDFREGLVAIARGGEAPEAARHVQGCKACAARLETERRLARHVARAMPEPPDDLLARAYGFMPTRPRLVARLVGSGLAASGARRSAPERFSLHFQVGEHEIPLQYVPVRAGWEVLGRLPADDWTVNGEAGRFRFAVPSLAESAFVIETPEGDVEIPAVESDGAR